MTFSEALDKLKAGKKIARDGWNGKGMYLFLISGEANSESISNYYGNGEKVNTLPSIGMSTIDSTGRIAFLNGWLASQTDLLSNDWVVVN